MLVLGSGAIYDMRHYHPKMKEQEWINFLPEDEHGYCKYVCEKIIENSSNIYDLRILEFSGNMKTMLYDLSQMPFAKPCLIYL